MGDTGIEFVDEDWSGAHLRGVSLRGATLRDVDLSRVRMRGVEMGDVDIQGALWDVTINGVEIVPLIEAELDRRYPERALMRPTDAAGYRVAWPVLERLWGETEARARLLDPELLHESVDGEWSFVQTLRHLVFATDAWFRRTLLGDPSPWSPLDLPFDQMRPRPGIPWDRDARPSLDEVLALRRDRWATVRAVLDDLTDERLAGRTEPVAEPPEDPGWPVPQAYPVRECLDCILSEEWEHRLYAERDLAVLEQRGH